MLSKQQTETRNYFNGQVKSWQSKATNAVYSNINDRHRAVQKCLDKYQIGANFLDVGCGTGQLAIEASAKGYNAIGIDFAEEMVEKSRANAQEADSAAEFLSASVFEYEPPHKLDVISAQGFIEYISLEELKRFLDFCHLNLSPGGSIAIGSRNRLFNLLSLNAYTALEAELGTVPSLLREATVISSGHEEMDSLIGELRQIGAEEELVQPDKHPITKIEVTTRYQFTPSDIVRRFEARGFNVKAFYPVRYHAFFPTAHADPELDSLREELSEFVSDKKQLSFKLIPYSSSFLVEAVKNEA